MALKRITPGLRDNTLVTKKHKFYTDIDLAFIAKPGSPVSATDKSARGDIYLKLDVAAIKQSIINILLTNRMEKPFNVDFGADLRNFLFDPIEQYSVSVIRTVIATTIDKYEPRVEVLSVDIYDLGSDKKIPRGAGSVDFWRGSNSDRYSIMVSVSVRVLNTNESLTVDVNMNRLR
jgi:phage baseplate assembly protein W|tara:strand:+ start:14081 stop:14608 length:528 start_codon:yes stop_codon:yes gene_type:complete